MRIAIAHAFLLLATLDAHAAFTDFSDYTERHTFATGDVFHSNGVAFKATQFRLLPNPVTISVTPAVNYHALKPGPGVDFLLPPSIQEITFSYSDGAGSAFAINGVEPQYLPNRAGFSHFDSVAVGGVSIDVDVLSQDSRIHNGQFIVTGESGIVTLRGPINSLVIAGLELALDDVFLRVPEPAADALLLTSAVVATAFSRRRLR